MSVDADKEEWIAERIAIIMEGCGYIESQLYLAETLARQRYFQRFEEHQPALF